jgi:3',5'-cyclic AMP phosphodiesterase CpdA
MKSFVQLSDTHIRAKGQLTLHRIDTSTYLSEAVKTVKNMPVRPDAVILTGDLADGGRPEEYEHLAELLEPLTMPYYLLPGNHDDRDEMRRSFSDHHYLGTPGQFIHYSIDLDDIVIISIDTSMRGQSAGALCVDRLGWLDEALGQTRDRAVVVAMHHPPFETYIDHMDQVGLLTGKDEFVEIIKKHPHVERIICGHLHRSIDARIGSTMASTAPSPAHQVELNLAVGAPPRWMKEPPGFKVHAWKLGGGLVSHLAYVGRFEGPYPL